MKIKRKTMKCDICYSDLLGDISEIEDPDERLEMLDYFCQLLQHIVYRETKIETLSILRKAFNLRNKDKQDKQKYRWTVEIDWVECPHLKEYPNIPHVACNPRLDCLHKKSKTHRCTQTNCPLKV